MRRRELDGLGQALEEFLDELTGEEHDPRRRSMKLYVTGLLLDGDRKSIGAMAGRLVDAPDEAEAKGSSLERRTTCSPSDAWSQRCRKLVGTAYNLLRMAKLLLLAEAPA